MKMTMMIIMFCPFPSNGAPVEWKWQGKTEVLGEKFVPVPLCPPQIPHGLTRDQTRSSAVGGRRLTAWAMARPKFSLTMPWSEAGRIETQLHSILTSALVEGVWSGSSLSRFTLGKVFGTRWTADLVGRRANLDVLEKGYMNIT
jgi:hypothetical protein